MPRTRAPATRAHAPRFVVGVNMPWGAYAGHDFGFHPRGWQSPRNDWTEIGAELEALAADGVTVVRWFVLAGGVNYPPPQDGTPRPAPQPIDELAERVSMDEHGRLHHGAVQGDAFAWVWRNPAEVAPLSDPFVSDFLSLCHACQDAGVQLMPCLLSFEWFAAPAVRDRAKDIYTGGRKPLIFGRDGDRIASIRRFLAATLLVLMKAVTAEFGAPHRLSTSHGLHPIFAWDLCNEPDWCVYSGPIWANPVEPTVSAQEMNTFLEEARRLVLDAPAEYGEPDSFAGYDFSIGFKAFDPPWLDPKLRKRLIRAGSRYWHQGHHYPTCGIACPILDRLLAMNRTLGPAPARFAQCLVGEFPSAPGQTAADIQLSVADWTNIVQAQLRWSSRQLTARQTQELQKAGNWRWGDRELVDSEADPTRYLHARLGLIAARQYSGALVWCAKEKAPDERTLWNEETRRQLRAFVSDLQTGVSILHTTGASAGR